MRNNKLGTIRTMADDLAGAPQGKTQIPQDTHEEEKKPIIPPKPKMHDTPIPAKSAVKSVSKPREIYKPAPKPLTSAKPEISKIPTPQPLAPPKIEIEEKPIAAMPVPKPVLPPEPKPELPAPKPVLPPEPKPELPTPKPLPEIKPILEPPQAQRPTAPQMPVRPWAPEIYKMPSPKAPPASLPLQPAIQKTSRELLDELLPMEEPIKKYVPMPPVVPKIKPLQDIQIAQPIQPKIRERNLEEEIFPTPEISEETPAETPEELLGIEIEKLEEEMPPIPQPPKMEIPEPPEPIYEPRETPPPVPPVPPQVPLSPPPAPPTMPMPPAPQIPYPAPKQPTQPAPPPSIITPSTPTMPAPIKQSIFARYKNLFMSKTVILTTLLIIIGAALVSTSLYFIFSRDGETEQVVNGEEEQEPVVDKTPPIPLVDPDFVLENISIEDALENNLITAINKLKSVEVTKDSIAYVPIRLEGVVVDNKAQFLKLQTFFSGLNIATPIEFFDVMEPDFMLYLYTPGDEERIACQNNLVIEKDCYGPRIGIVFRTKPGYTHRLEPILAQWLDLIKQYDSNLDRFILNSLVQMPQTIEFKEGTYSSKAVLSAKEVRVNYVNIPMPQYDNLELSGTALDLAAINDMLIIATSKNSMRKIIDYILKQ